MDYLLLNESEVQSKILTEKQKIIRDSVNRILSDEDPIRVASELLRNEIVTVQEIDEMINWIKSHRGKRNAKGTFRSLRKRGAI